MTGIILGYTVVVLVIYGTIAAGYEFIRKAA